MSEFVLSRRSLVKGAAAGAGLAVVPWLGAAGRANAAAEVDLGTIALVPLDDRPYTWYAPQELAGAAGYAMVTPEHHVLGRHFTPGDGRAAGHWLVRAAHRADAVVVALPMLAYGGLLNSRNSSVSRADAERQLEAVRTVKRQNPRKRLYAFDTIMRLTPEGPWRTQLRIWATLVDEVENLGMEDKRAELEALEAEIPLEVREDYLATRARNHEINLRMISWAAEGVIDFLVMGQDDASGTGLHRPEAQALLAHIEALGVGDRVKLYPGADVVASVLLAKIAVEDAAVRPQVYVEYSRVHGDEWTAPYQNIPYAELIKGYVEIIGGRVVDHLDDADIVLMANTGGSSASVVPFADRLVQYVRDGRTVALGDDAIAGRSDPRLLPLLDEHIQRGELDSYSGWNIGIPISQSLSRFALLARARSGQLPPGRGRGAGPERMRRELLRRAARDSLEVTVSEWVQTDSYRNFERTATTEYASSLGEPDPQNLRTYYDEVDEFARNRTLPHAQELFDTHFAGVSRTIGDLGSGPEALAAQSVAEWNIYLPWLRTGEIAAEPVMTFEPIG